MPFRLARFCLRTFSSILLISFFVVEANAGMTITSTRRGITGGAHTFYYTTAFTPAATQFFDTYDPNYVSPNELGTVDDQVLSINDTASRSHILSFNVATDTSLPALPSGQVYVLAFQYKEATNRLIPITQVNGVNCSAFGACADYNLTQVGGYNFAAGGTNVVGPYWFGAVFTPGSTINVGIYASEVCNFYALQGGTTLGGTNPCVASGSTALPNSIATQPAVLPLKARIYTMPITAGTAYSTAGASGVALAAVDTNFPAKDSLDIYLHFQEEAGTTNCASPLSRVYYPGDSLISVDTTHFSYTTTTANHASGNVILGLGNGGTPAAAAPIVTNPGYQNNPVVGRLPFSGSQPLGGFINSPVGTDFLYDVEFLIRDYGGLVVPAAVPANCTYYQDVMVTSIQGFLNRSSCFIATAAFGSGEEAPVMMLRKFRDRILLKFNIGEQFVQWYYSWSPKAAEWLMEHPVFRVPVLVLLIPLQAVAWLTLHPFILCSLLIISLGILSIPFFPGAKVEE